MKILTRENLHSTLPLRNRMRNCHRSNSNRGSIAVCRRPHTLEPEKFQNSPLTTAKYRTSSSLLLLNRRRRRHRRRHNLKKTKFLS